MERIRRILENRIISLTFWAGLSIVLLYLALRDVQLTEVISTIAATDWRFMLVGLGSVGINLLAKTIRWQVLLRHSGQSVPLSVTWMALIAGQTLNWFLPGRVGDVARIYAAGRFGPSRSYVLGTIGLEKVFDTVSYALLFILALGILPLPAWLSDSGYTLVVVTTVMVLSVTGLAMRPASFIRMAEVVSTWLPEKWRDRGLTWLRLGLSSLEVLHSRVDVIQLVFWTVVVWVTAVFNNYAVGLAMGLQFPWTAALLVLVILQAGISLPGVPGRIGMFQYLCILALAIFGISQAAAFSYGIILQALVLLPTTLISLPSFIWLGPIKSNSGLAAPRPDTSSQRRVTGKD